MPRSYIKHGFTGTPEYVAWKHMRQRCYNPNDRWFNDYGGRGVSICSEWRDNFVAFLEYIGPRPSPKHSVDRFPDHNGDYEPGNVRWATTAEQQANARDRGPALSVALRRAHREKPDFNGFRENAARYNRARQEGARC